MNSKEKKAYKRDKEKALAKKEKENEAKKKSDPFYEYRCELDLDGKQVLEEMKDPLADATEYASHLINLDITIPKVAFQAFKALVNLYIAKGNFFLQF